METFVRVPPDHREALAAEDGARGVPPSNLGVLAVVALTLIPWILVVLLTGGIATAINMLGYATTVALIGYVAISVALPVGLRLEGIVLAPALGILIASALTTFWVRFGFPVFYAVPMWLVLAAVGALCFWRDREEWAKVSIPYGKSLVVLSSLICFIFFVPGARRDAVLRNDGSFHWMYVDTQYNYAIAASIKDAKGVPTEPGSVTAPLYYHFGGYAPAGAISRFDGLDLGDSFVRVTRAASLWALVLSCFGIGTILGFKATGEKFGGIMSVAGFFFYGSLLALFTDERNSSSTVSGAILFNIPEIGVGHDGGPFSHVILGHSELHAFIAITAIMGLCLLHRESEKVVKWTMPILVVLPALAVAMHSVASLYCLGIAIILLYWGRLGSLRSWIQIVLMFGLFVLAWKTMGFGHSPDALHTRIGLELTQQWWTLAAAFLIGLGFRIIGFGWIKRTISDVYSTLVLATVLGLLSFYLLVHFKNGEEIYGVFFLQSVFSIFAFSRLPYGFWRRSKRSEFAAEWLRLAAIGTLIVGLCGILSGAIGYATTHVAGINYFRLKIIAIFVLLGCMVISSAMMKRISSFSVVASAALMGILSVGFLAWIAPWSNFGLGRMKMDVPLTAGEVESLTLFKHLAAPGERFATNKHIASNVANNLERSYAYAPFSEHPVLVEGFLYHQLMTTPGFDNLLRDNDTMFATNDPQTLHDLCHKWGVKWLVARPNTDIALPRPLPSWLVEEQNGGDLKIYDVN